MGLDMYMYRYDNKITSQKELENICNDLNTVEEIAYWRKHPDLHGRMSELYYEKGGEREFNCTELLLTKDDIEDIIEDIQVEIKEGLGTRFKRTRGFFFGETSIDQWEESLKDFKKILKDTDWENETVYYYSWW